jgi:endogenous inhibitor of DNA gyrase (YacG/DUF329 family)
MGAAVAEANRPLGARKACPRCQALLHREIDKQRTTTFEAFRCPTGHGRYLTFSAFLRAKNFVRDLTPAEITELRRHVISVKCTGCGAAVDVRERSACAFCHAPIAIIDPEQLQRTIAELQSREAERPKPVPGKSPLEVDPTLPLRLAHERLRAERVFADLAQHQRATGGFASIDLVDVGLSSLVSLLGHLGDRV